MELVHFTVLQGQLKAKVQRTGKRLEQSIPGESGLNMIVQPSGKWSFAFRYRRPGNGKTAKLTLEAKDLQSAVTEAESCRALLKQRVDPEIIKSNPEVAEAATDHGETVDKLFVRFMNDYPTTKNGEARQTTKEHTGKLLGLKPDANGKWVPTGNGALSAWTGRAFAKKDGTPLITRKDAKELLQGKPLVMHNRMLSALRLFGRWCVEWEIVNTNPFEGIRKHSEANRERSRVLSDDEIRRLWHSVTTANAFDPYAMGTLLMLATAQRPSEVFEATWDEIDLDAKVWTIPGARAKNGQEHKVPLSPLVLRLLSTIPGERTGYVLPREAHVTRPLVTNTFQKGRVFKQAGIVGATYHDMRRTAETGMIALGVDPYVAERVTNHMQQGMLRHYNHHDYMPQKKAALDLWAGHLEGLTAPRS